MKKLYIFISLNVAFASVTLSQKVSETVQTPNTENAIHLGDVKFIGKNNNSFFIVSTAGDYLKCYSLDKCSQIFSKKLSDVSIEKKKLEFSKAVMLKGKIYTFYCYYDKSLKKSSLFYSEINTETGEPIVNLKELSICSLNAKYGYSDIIEISSDSSLVMIVRPTLIEKGEVITINVLTFDHSMKNLTDKTITKPYPNNSFFEKDKYSIDSKGNIYCVVDVVPYKKIKLYGTYIYALTASDNDFVEIQLPEPEKSIKTIIAGRGVDGKVIYSGVYINTKNLSELGLFAFKFSKEGKTVSTCNYYPFTSEMQVKLNGSFYKEDWAVKNGYAAREIIPLEDGGFIFTSERYVKYDHVKPNGLSWKSYHYGDMIVARIDSSLKFMWTNVSPKMQCHTDDRSRIYLYNDYLYSFSTAVSNKYVYLFFNDSPKNSAVTADNVYNGEKIYKQTRDDIEQSVPVYHAIDISTGKLVSRNNINLKDASTSTLAPLYSTRISKSSFLIVKRSEFYVVSSFSID